MPAAVSWRRTSTPPETSMSIASSAASGTARQVCARSSFRGPPVPRNITRPTPLLSESPTVPTPWIIFRPPSLLSATVVLEAMVRRQEDPAHPRPTCPRVLKGQTAGLDRILLSQAFARDNAKGRGLKAPPQPYSLSVYALVPVDL